MTTTLPKLLGAASFRPFRCIWMLEELGIPYNYVPELPGGSEARQYHPLGKVPVLVDSDGFVMYESMAINTYLGDKYRSANPTLVPEPGTHKRGLYDQTSYVLAAELDAQCLWIQQKHEKMGDIYTHIPDAVTHAKKYFRRTSKSLMKQIKQGDGPYLLGEEFTAVDMSYVHCLEWSKNIGWSDMWEPEQEVMDYLSLCRSRPSYAKLRELRNSEADLVKAFHSGK
eukprot:Nitzschia sp. Nitz4//scaffold48_size128905//43691//44368//NITZ4_003591-RA/size128905-processed-gene-0.112-mRNA-1//-1//CDS//3329552955//8045//frame0